MLTISCRHCGQRFGVAEHLYGKQVACTTCGGKLDIPVPTNSSVSNASALQLQRIADTPAASRSVFPTAEQKSQGNLVVVIACVVGGLVVACLVLGIVASVIWDAVSERLAKVDVETGLANVTAKAEATSDRSVEDTVGPPTVPDRFVFRPTFVTSRGTASAGTAFITMLPAQATPVAVTAIHLLGPAGGLDQDVPGVEVPEVIRQVVLQECYDTDLELDVGGKALSIPSAAPLNSPSEAGDIAAFWVVSSSLVSALPLAESDPVVGERVWLAGPVIGGAPRDQRLHSARVLMFEKQNVYYQYDNPQLELRATSGAPVLNAKGEVIAINLGGGELEGNVIGVGNPVGRFRSHLLRAAINPPSVVTASATTASPAMSESVPPSTPKEDESFEKRKAIYVAFKMKEVAYERHLATRDRMHQQMLDRMKAGGSSRAKEGMSRTHENIKKQLAESHEREIDILCRSHDITRDQLAEIVAEGDAGGWTVPSNGQLVE